MTANARFWSEKLTVPESTAITLDAIQRNIEWSQRELAYARENSEVFAEALC